MNYEELLSSLEGLTKQLKESLSSANKGAKILSKELDMGDLEGAMETLGEIELSAANLAEASAKAKAEVRSFDGKEYMESGEFASQMLSCFEEEGIDISGEYPVYEAFPFRIKLDAEAKEVTIDKKRYACLRPDKIAEIVKEGQQKLNKASFNASAFLNELYDAYQVHLLQAKKTKDSDAYLTSLYKLMVPMARSRKEYDAQSFAFDLARLYPLRDELLTKGGMAFQFGSSRDASKAIRILDQDGKEQFLCTICFFKR